MFRDNQVHDIIERDKAILVMIDSVIIIALNMKNSLVVDHIAWSRTIRHQVFVLQLGIHLV